ncbi:response regulator [Massilia niabensis]|uniref:Response regulator n=1 Tax=Massilia niabensis TaxID=544910 RepID=A0ABW0L0P5_9BURK
MLIVDDNADAALVLSVCLSAYGHETAVAYSGPEGVQLAHSFEPDIVFLDLGMPRVSGYEVAVALRKIPRLARVYIAALTGWNDPKTREQVVSAGFNRHLTKPAKVEVMLELVEKAVA